METYKEFDFSILSVFGTQNRETFPQKYTFVIGFPRGQTKSQYRVVNLVLLYKITDEMESVVT